MFYAISDTTCSDQDVKPSPFVSPAILYIERLINPGTGMVASRKNECFTTVYKNSLASMVFLHEGNIEKAEQIFDVYKNYLEENRITFIAHIFWPVKFSNESITMKIAEINCKPRGGDSYKVDHCFSFGRRWNLLRCRG